MSSSKISNQQSVKTWSPDQDNVSLTGFDLWKIEQVKQQNDKNDKKKPSVDDKKKEKLPKCVAIEYRKKMNEKCHSTDKYKLDKFHGTTGSHELTVLRRGRPFVWSASFDKALDPAKHDVYVFFRPDSFAKVLVNSPSIEKIKVDLSDLDTPKPCPDIVNGDAQAIRVNKNDSLQLQLQLPVDAAIGLWNVAFVVVKKGMVVDETTETDDDGTQSDDATDSTVTISSKRNGMKSKKAYKNKWVTKGGSKPKDVLNTKSALKPKDTTDGNNSDKTDKTDDDDADATIEPKWQKNAPLMLIANPWNKEDETYLKTQSWRKAYLLEEEGYWWRHADSKNKWEFDQFELVTMQGVLQLLKSVDLEDRQNIPKLIRKLVWSNWKTGSFPNPFNFSNFNGQILKCAKNKCDSFDSNDTHAEDWTNSSEIFKKWRKTTTDSIPPTPYAKQLKYGKSWVYAALMTTIARALGIPSRMVTNECSGRDVNKTMTVDYVHVRDSTEDSLDKTSFTLNEEQSETIAEFHVWTEIYTSRSDLSRNGKYDGWQAVDATPALHLPPVPEALGPMPVLAIKNGDVDKSYDGWYWYSAVNADVVHFFVDKTTKQPSKKEKAAAETAGIELVKETERKVLAVSTDTKAIGRALYTDDITNADKCKNITDSYKYASTDKERTANNLAIIKNVKAVQNDYWTKLFESRTNLKDIDRKVIVTLAEGDNTVEAGKDIEVKLNVKNTSETYQTVNIQLVLRHEDDDDHEKHVAKCLHRLTVKANSTKEFKSTIPADVYAQRLGQNWALRASVIADVDSHQEWLTYLQKSILMVKPDLEISLLPAEKPNALAVVAAKPVTDVKLKLSFKNPMNLALSSIEFKAWTVVKSNKKYARFTTGETKPASTLDANATATAFFTLSAERIGTYKVYAEMSTGQIGKFIAWFTVVITADDQTVEAESTIATDTSSVVGSGIFGSLTAEEQKIFIENFLKAYDGGCMPVCDTQTDDGKTLLQQFIMWKQKNQQKEKLCVAWDSDKDGVIDDVVCFDQPTNTTTAGVVVDTTGHTSEDVVITNYQPNANQQQYNGNNTAVYVPPHRRRDPKPWSDTLCEDNISIGTHSVGCCGPKNRVCNDNRSIDCCSAGTGCCNVGCGKGERCNLGCGEGDCCSLNAGKCCETVTCGLCCAPFGKSGGCCTKKQEVRTRRIDSRRVTISTPSSRNRRRRQGGCFSRGD